jgi:hypothetical protein
MRYDFHDYNYNYNIKAGIPERYFIPKIVKPNQQTQTELTDEE